MFQEFKEAAAKNALDAEEADGGVVLSRDGQSVLKVIGAPGAFRFEYLVDCPELSLLAGQKLAPSDQYDVPQHAATSAAGLCEYLRIKAPAPVPVEEAPATAPEEAPAEMPGE